MYWLEMSPRTRTCPPGKPAACTITGGRLRAADTGGTGALTCAGRTAASRVLPPDRNGYVFLPADTLLPLSYLNVTCDGAAGAVTVLINVVRISLIGVMPQYYANIHGPVGSTLASWATIATMLAIFSYGIGFRDQNSP